VFGIKPIDPFKELLTKARGIASERTKILNAIHENEARLAEGNQALASAQARIAEEEFQAAQSADGIAVASAAALQAVADAQLKVKSYTLRLLGLRTKRHGLDEALTAVAAELDDFRQQFLAGQIAKLRDQFDDAIEGVIRLFVKTEAIFVQCRTNEVRDKLQFVPYASIHRTSLRNPLSGEGAIIWPGCTWWMRGGQPYDRDKFPQSDPGVCEFLSELRAIEAQIAEATGTASAGEEQQV
jgi:hypothetical protein